MVTRTPLPPRLYGIADVDTLGLEQVPAAVKAMSEAGIEWIQIRAKSSSGSDFFSLAEHCLRLLEGSETRLWIDDRADLAALLPLAGVHVGQDDLPPSAVRAAVGRGPWIGRSTHDLDQAAAAQADADVDVVAFGPIFPTRSKERPDPVVGLELLRQVRKLVDKPLVAIGGIDAENLASVLRAGADCVAILGGLCRGDVTGNSRRLLNSAKEAR